MTKTKQTKDDLDLTSKDAFINEYRTLSKAAVGVVIVRTREPYRALSGLHEFALDNKNMFSVWKISNGWNTYDMTDIEAEPKADNETAPVAALRKIGESIKPADGCQGFLYAMMWPHSFCNKNFSIPEMVQLIAEYTKLFSEQLKRLVLVVPPDYVVPLELEDSVVMLDTDLPTQDELREVYEDLVVYINQASKRGEVSITDEEVPRILAAGAGMTVAEFENTLARAFRHFSKTITDIDIDDFVRFVSKTKAEIVKRSEVLELMPLGTMSEVGGLENLKEWVGIRKAAYEPEAREYGVDRPKGTALIGPPGTGKSLCAKAIAHELGLPLIRFDVSRVFNQFVGSSESRVREALKMCDAMAPCVIGSTLIRIGSGETTTAEALYAQEKIFRQTETVHESGETVPVTINGVIRRELDAGIKLLTIVDEDDNSITVTENHKLLVKTKNGTEWREAGSLKEGDELVRG